VTAVDRRAFADPINHWRDGPRSDGPGDPVCRQDVGKNVRILEVPSRGGPEGAPSARRSPPRQAGQPAGPAEADPGDRRARADPSGLPQRVGIRQLLKRGKKDIILLSREKIEDLINRSVKASVEKHLAEGSRSKVTVSQLEGGNRRRSSTSCSGRPPSRPKISIDPAPDILKLIKSFAANRPPAQGIGARPSSKRTARPRRIVRADGTSSPGRGLDIGTVTICAGARMKGSGRTVYNTERNAFPGAAPRRGPRGRCLSQGRPRLRPAGANRAFILGDPAFHLANLFEKKHATGR